MERSTYVLAATAALALPMWRWRPIPERVIWAVDDPSIAAGVQAVFWLGWAVVLASTFLISHLDLFGLRQRRNATSLAQFGERYCGYRSQVGMLLPRLHGRAGVRTVRER